MNQIGARCESEEKRSSLKRKRDSKDNEDLENMPPAKISPKYEDVTEEQVNSVIAESSPCTSDEDGSQTDSQSRSNYTELDYNPDSFLSPPSISDLSNYVLSPLENVAKGDSTPHSNKRLSKREPPPPLRRKCPLPGLSWGDPADVWRDLCETDEQMSLQRSSKMFDNHPQLEPMMRAILLDWLNEVSEVYKLHRETFHLTVEYIDRYLTKTDNVPKDRLQLTGITCLFIAAKVEEVFPPKISEFSYVTDGACTVDEILLQELHIMNILSWSITPVTINGWLNIYMQLASEARSAKHRLISESDTGANALRGYTFVFPQYSSLEFVICGQLIDLAILHVDVNKYQYSVVAAAAIAHTYSKELAMRVSGLNWESIDCCYQWLAPSVAVLRSADTVTVVPGGGDSLGWGQGGLAIICPNLNTDDAHRIQVHNVTLDMFKLVYELHWPLSDTEASPGSNAFPPTPPNSNHKSPGSATTTKTPIMKHTPPDTEAGQ